MLKNYLTVAIRNLWRNKTYSFINIAGLAVGLAACITIFIYVKQELSYDRFHSKADRIYRVALHYEFMDDVFDEAVTLHPLAGAMVNDIPEVENAARLSTTQNRIVQYGGQVFREERMVVADSSFLDIFDVPFLAGDPGTALKAPNNVLVTISTARRYFGDDDPIGRVITTDLQGGTDLQVAGVIEDFPPNSHFHYDFIISGLTVTTNNYWNARDSYTYVLLEEGASPESVNAGLIGILETYLYPMYEQMMRMPLAQMGDMAPVADLYLQPLTDIHLYSHLDQEIEVGGHVANIFIFSSVAFFILLLACINFMNLVMEQSISRVREVGVRKVIGSRRLNLLAQFLTEAGVMALLGVCLAILLVLQVLPWINSAAGIQLQLKTPDLLWVLLGTGVVVAFTGTYPAFVLAAFNPVEVLRGGFLRAAGGAQVRNGLVVLQFIITGVLLTGTLVVRNQVNYMTEKDLGYTPENMLIIKNASSLEDIPGDLTPRLREHPAVLAATRTTLIPGAYIWPDQWYAETPLGRRLANVHIHFMDDAFADVYETHMVGGRFALRDSIPIEEVVINEAAARAFGIENPVGERLYSSPTDSTGLLITGVVADFHYQSLSEAIQPTVFADIDWGPNEYFIVRLSSDSTPATLASIEKIWRDFTPDQPFEYVFMDDHIRSLYGTEYRTMSLAGVFSILAIIIACMGLFGLASLATTRRTKEIGIRKVVGASITQVVTLLSKEFLVLVAIANVIAWPIAWFAMSRWLENFAYRISLSWWLFGLAGLLALLIALATVSWQTIRAATANPVEALRYE